MGRNFCLCLEGSEPCPWQRLIGCLPPVSFEHTQHDSQADSRVSFSVTITLQKTQRHIPSTIPFLSHNHIFLQKLASQADTHDGPIKTRPTPAGGTDAPNTRRNQEESTSTTRPTKDERAVPRPRNYYPCSTYNPNLGIGGVSLGYLVQRHPRQRP